MNLGAVFAWAGAPAMIHSFTGAFPVNFQNAFRYLVAVILLWPSFLLSQDGALVGMHLRKLRSKAPGILVIALVTYAFQVCYTYSLFLLPPSLMSLLNQTQVVFAVLFAVLFFRDERAFIFRPIFLLGLAAALAGVVLVVAGGRNLDSRGLFMGVLVILLSAACWALLGCLLRAWVPDVPPLLCISSVFTLVVPLFAATYAIAHRGLPMPQATTAQWLTLLLSGIVAIGVGHSLFYRSVGVLGVSVSASIGLLSPLLASLISYLVFGDALSALQLAGAAILLVGCFLIIRARFKAAGGMPSR